MIEAALAKSRGKVAGPRGAAATRGIPASTLESKIKQLPENLCVGGTVIRHAPEVDEHGPPYVTAPRLPQTSGRRHLIVSPNAIRAGAETPPQIRRLRRPPAYAPSAPQHRRRLSQGTRRVRDRSSLRWP